MRVLTYGAALVIAIYALMSFPILAKADLTVISFGGAVRHAQEKAYYEPFTHETGITINPGEYNGELAIITYLVNSKKVTWDVIEVESAELHKGCEEGVFQRLDYSQIGDRNDFIPKAITKCGIGTFTWATVLAYNPHMLSPAPTSWQDFWDVKKFPGKRGLRKGAKFTLEIALLADGVNPTDVYTLLATEEGIERALKKLTEIKPWLRWWKAGDEAPKMLSAGDLVMSSAYSGRIADAQRKGKNLKVVWNGLIYDVDYWAIPTGSEKLQEAYKFIRFASTKSPQITFSNEIAYGPTNVQALESLDRTVAGDLPTAPRNLQGAIASNTEFWAKNGAELEKRFTLWLHR